MQVAVGHKGKTAYRAFCRGQAGHSALAPNFVNALFVAVDLVDALRALQSQYEENGALDAYYDIPFTTFHVGKFSGGRALNIVPDRAEITFESRYLAQDGEARVFADITKAVDGINAIYRDALGEDAIRFETLFTYPGLEVSETALATQVALGLVDNKKINKVAFGTEAGTFAALGIPTIVCGPGSMADQGHKPDEFITLDQLYSCEASLTQSIEILK